MYSSPKALCSTKGWFFGLPTGPGSPWPLSPGLVHRLEVLTWGEQEGGDQQLRTSQGLVDPLSGGWGTAHLTSGMTLEP